MTQPKGILEDVLFKVGIPFLAAGTTLIDVKKEELTLRVGT